MSKLIGVFMCVLAFAGVYAQDNPVSMVCLGCICEAASGCKTSLGCDGDVCGPFRITWAYWADAGKPTLGEPNTNEGAYARCVNNVQCASDTVKGYMMKYARDCNGDGTIDCNDYVRIHRFGRNACTNPLDQKYENVYNTCMRIYG